MTRHFQDKPLSRQLKDGKAGVRDALLTKMGEIKEQERILKLIDGMLEKPSRQFRYTQYDNFIDVEKLIQKIKGDK